MAIVGGLVAAVASAVLWALASATTGIQVGYMALAVGCLVGGAVRLLGRGLDRPFGYLGAGMSLFGCLLGNLLTLCNVVAHGAQVPLTAVLTHIRPADIVAVMIRGFHPLDALFYGIAVYEGYRFSFRRLTEAKLRKLAGEG